MDKGMLLRALEPMLNNKLGNYIVPGLSSYLVGGKDHGKVRLFHAERDVEEFITPHSHRFNFSCLVLEGYVTNTLYREVVLGTNEYNKERSEAWCKSTINQVCGLNGILNYTHTRDSRPNYYYSKVTKYTPGDTYEMTHKEIHSIRFQKGSKVIFFEGPQITATSVMIEPWVNGKVIPTFKTEDWMFERS